MPTYVSVLNWSGRPQPRTEDVRQAISSQEAALRGAGMHSVVFLPDEGECAAIMVATCDDARAVTEIASSILPATEVQIETMLFDDDPGVPAWAVREAAPPPVRDFRRALLEAIVADG